MANKKLAPTTLQAEDEKPAIPRSVFKVKPRPGALEMRSVHDDTAKKFPRTIARLAE